MDIKEQIKERLIQQNLIDLKRILQTPEGRRFFSWLMMETGRDIVDFKGNSRDIFTAGMRNVAVMLITYCKAIGIEGFDLMCQAEREYIVLQQKIHDEITRKNKPKQ